MIVIVTAWFIGDWRFLVRGTCFSVWAFLVLLAALGTSAINHLSMLHGFPINEGILMVVTDISWGEMASTFSGPTTLVQAVIPIVSF